MKNPNMFSLRLMVLFVAASLAAFACRNPVDDIDDHAEAVGFVIEQNNAEILRFENNQFVFNRDGVWNEYFREFDGQLRFTLSPDVIPDMTRGMTPSVVIRWLDANSNVFNLPEEADGGDYRLEWDWEKAADEVNCDPDQREGQAPDENIRPANLEQHGDDGSWGFHFRADHVGQDRIRFRLFHGDHDDFVAGWLEVVVADDEHELIQNGQYMHSRSRCRVR